MIRALAALAALAGLLQCSDDSPEALAGAYSGPDVTWRLVSLDGASYTASATLRFTEDSRIAGDAPCNAYSGPQEGSYPAFAPGPVVATRRACPELEAESAFFTALGEMTEAQIAGDSLTLSGENGSEMRFERTD